MLLTKYDRMTIGIAVTAHMQKKGNIIIKVSLLIISTFKSWGVGREGILVSDLKGKTFRLS